MTGGEITVIGGEVTVVVAITVCVAVLVGDVVVVVGGVVVVVGGVVDVVGGVVVVVVGGARIKWAVTVWSLFMTIVIAEFELVTSPVQLTNFHPASGTVVIFTLLPSLKRIAPPELKPLTKFD